MNQPNPADRSTGILTARRNSPLALVVLLIVIGGLLSVVFAPAGTFGPAPQGSVLSGH